MYLNAELYIHRRSMLLEKFQQVGKILKATRQQPEAILVRSWPPHAFGFLVFPDAFSVVHVSHRGDGSWGV